MDNNELQVQGDLGCKMKDYSSEETIIEDVKVSNNGKTINAVQCFYADEFQYNEADEGRIVEIYQQFTHLESKDEPRHDNSSESGGKVCRDKRIIQSMRSVAKYVITQIGKKILSGDMNLTKISFPIRGMIAKSNLEKNLASTIFFPLYINKACATQDQLERVKLTIAACLSTFFINLSFFKPLNPILGETIQGYLNDGTQLFAEQINHHPPVSAFYVIGPNQNYHYYGNYNYDASSRINSIMLKNKGRRVIRYKDGQTIRYNFAYEQYSGTIMGSTKVETLGKLEFHDKENNIEAIIKFGKVKKRPTDYFQGTILKDGVIQTQIYGSYMGFLEFDGVRYWDYRFVEPYKVFIEKPTLPSDPQFRSDYQLLQKLDLEGAQKEKELLEDIQRSDQKLRAKQREIQHKIKQKF